jgi:uncharacterized repeat protein (TIGR01451 family)
MVKNQIQHMGKDSDKSAAGQALVEFALIISFVLVFAFIIIESGRLFQAWQTVQNAAREAGRYALTGQYDPSCLSANPACLDPRVHSIRQRSLAAATGLVIDPNAGPNDPNHFRTEVYAHDANGNLQAGYAGVAGQPVYVRVTYRMGLITPVLSSLFPSVLLNGSVTVNNEDFDQFGLSPGGPGSPIGINPPPPQEIYPDLWLVMESLPEQVILGEEYDYRLLIYNIGDITAANVQLVNTLPEGTSFISATGGCNHSAGVVSCASLGNLEPDEVLQVMIQARAPISIPNSPWEIFNSAEVSTTTPEDITGNNSQTVTTRVISLGSDLVGTGMSNLPEPVLAGQEYILKTTVANWGPDLITTTNTSLVITVTTTSNIAGTPLDFALLDSTVPCVRDANLILCELESLDKDETVSVFLTIGTFSQQSGRIQHNAYVSADQFDPDTDNNNNSSALDVVPSEADLRVTAASQPAKVMTDEPVLYRLQVVNLGPAIANNIVVTNTLPAYGEFVSVSGPSCGQPAGRVLTCTIGKLSPLFGQNVIDIIVEMRSDEESIEPMVNRIEAEADEVDPNPFNNTAQAITLIEETDLVISKGPSVSEENRLIAGDEFTFTIIVTNTGPTPATGVNVLDILDPTFQFVSATATQGACQHSGTSPGGTVRCSIGSLAAGSSATIALRIVPTIGGSSQGQGSPIQYFNTAEVRGNETDPDLDNNSSTASIWVLQGDQFITLSTSCGDPGQTITVAGYNWEPFKGDTNNWGAFRYGGEKPRSSPPTRCRGQTITDTGAPQSPCLMASSRDNTR